MKACTGPATVLSVWLSTHWFCCSTFYCRSYGLRLQSKVICTTGRPSPCEHGPFARNSDATVEMSKILTKFDDVSQMWKI
ncbi:hypothetical protein PR003_g17487 [Phytophthora rubi]|uniref:Uncharacterized protein n=1 Tax=Phytophthora rubi TaxID=129364 RepID=A0A6A3MW31_9STRA|nr:hypothetical protein PR002_g8636 [Phytophthora rubi]KAE9037383.1 hypothetical protein PR001_g8397 [Phytophthora rubi]KAE9321402.1 hypothetical protein PR003_g17487 [Phytophthora rubi]